VRRLEPYLGAVSKIPFAGLLSKAWSFMDGLKPEHEEQFGLEVFF
jgi:hypothetical protein